MPIDPQLQKVVNYLVTAEAAIAEGSFGGEQRPWLNFASVAVAGKFDFAAVHEIFTRAASNNAYVSARADKNALAKTIQTAKLSGDYLAGFERDYRMRTRSRVRTLIHAGNRAAANGSPAGPLRKNTLDWFSRILAEST